MGYLQRNKPKNAGHLKQCLVKVSPGGSHPSHLPLHPLCPCKGAVGYKGRCKGGCEGCKGVRDARVQGV